MRELEIPAYGDDEVQFMTAVVEKILPTAIFEWGTNVGASARIFYETVSILLLDCQVHTVDLPIELAYRDRDHPGHRLGQFIQGVPVTQHLGEGLEVSLRWHEALKPERTLFYIDGDHSYETVLTELRTLSTTVPGAVLLMHDTRHLRSVATALSDFRPKRLYEIESLASQAGMIALWPRAR